MLLMEQDAANFAAQCHKDQKRKYTGEPYIVHPESVANIVRKVPHTIEMLCAAWLHDVVEDCGITFSEIENKFGAKVREYVYYLTDISILSKGNRAARKQIDREHIAYASAEVKTIKLADLIDNTASITKHDKNFSVVYMAEKKELLKVLSEGDETLYKKATELVEKYYAELV